MATITNLIQTVFNSSGVNTVTRDINTLSRNQTRLGQASASAGRAFSAQASGLGGLVAAYAGAAATTFALQQAFDKLAKSAQALQTLQGLNTLAAESAISGQALVKSIQDITKGQLTLFEAAAQTNLALSAGFDSRQIEGLASVAIKASRALGRDLTDAMTRVVRGSAKMETELLDELGIYTKIEPATRAYAAAMGKAVGELTEYERRQAFVNSVIDEGTRKFSAINTTVPTAAEQIEAFGAKMVELSTIFLGFLAEGVAPLASFLTNNFAASLGAVGAILALVASKGVALLNAAFANLAASALASGRVAENKARILFGLADAARTATSAIAGLNLATFRGTQAEKTQIASLQDSAKARALTRAELIQSQKLIQNNITSLNAERAAYRDNIRAAAIARGELERARAMPRGPVPGDLSNPIERARNSAIRAANIQIAATRPAAIAAVQALPALRAQLTQLETAFAATATAATGARAAIAGFATTVATGLSVAISRVGILAGLVLGAASKILFVVTVVQLFGSAIANFLGKGEEFESFFKNLGKTISSALGITQARELKQAITGIVGGSLAEIEKTNAELANLDKFTFKQSKFLGIKIEVEKSKEEVVREVTSILQEVANPVEKTAFTIAADATKGALGGAALGFITGGFKGAIVGAIGGGVISGILSAFTSDAVTAATNKFGGAVRAEFAGAFTDLNLDTGSQDAAVRAISVLRERYGAIASVDPQARAFLKLNEQLVLESVKYVKNIELVSSVMAATGQTADAVSRNLNFDAVLPQIEGIKQAVMTISGIDIVVAIQTKSAEEAFQKFLLDVNNNATYGFSVLRDTISQSIWGVKDYNTLTREALELYKNSDNIQAVINDLLIEGTQESAILAKALTVLKQNSIAASDVLTGDNLLKASSVFTSLSGSISEANSSLLRSGEVIRSVDQGISTSSLSLEQFEQKMGSAASAIAIAEQELVAANKQQDRLNQLIKDADPNDSNTQALLKQRDALSAQKEILLETLPLYKEAYNIQKQQEESLKAQIQLTEFIRSQTPKSANVLSVALESYTKNTEFAQAKTIEFVQTLASSGISEGNLLRENIVKADRLNLSLEQRTQLLGATVTTGDAIAKSLDRQEDITAKMVGDYILITTELANGQSVTEVILLQERDRLDLAQQNVELTALQAKLGEKLIFDSISLLSNQEAYLSKLRETNSLKQRELELSLATANEESRKIQSALEIGRVELTVDSAKQSLEIERARLEIADLQADTATKALERQIMLQENLNDRRQQQLSREIESQERVLAILQRQGEARELLVSIATPLDKQGSNEAAIFREQLNNRAQVLAQETVLLELQEKQARESLAGQMEVARLQKSQAAAELRTVSDRIKAQKNIIYMELSLFKQEQAFAKQQLDEQIAANANQILLNEQQSQLRKDQLVNEQKLELKKATDAANQLLEQIKVINLQDEVFTKFTDNLNKIVTQLTGQGVSDLVKAPANTEELSSSLKTFKQNIESSYSEIFVLQDLALAKELSNNANRLANEQELLKGKAESLREYQKITLEVAEQRAAVEKAALDESLEAAKAAYTEQLNRSVDLTNSQLDIDREYNDNRNALLEQFAISVLQEYEKVQKAGQQLVLDFANQVKSIQRETEALKQEAITIRVKADFDAKQAASQLQQQIAEADISRMQAEIRLVDARADIKEIPAIEAAKQVNDLQMKILAKQEEVERIRFAREDAQLAQEQTAALEQFARTKAEIEARRDIAIQEAQARQQAVAAQATTLAKFLIENASVWNAAIERLRQVLQTGASSIGLAIASQGTQVGAVTSGGAIAASVGGLVSVVSQSQAAFEGLKTTITENAAAAVAVEQEKTREFFLNKGREREALRQAHESTIQNIGIQKQTEDALAKKRIQDAKDAGSASAEKAKEAAEKIADAYKDITDKVKESLRSVATEVINIVGGILTSIAQSKVEQLQVQETQVQDALAFATEKLNDVRSELEKSLQEETDQRAQLVDLTKQLTENQQSYIESLGAQDKIVKESSDLYIEKLLEQKQAILTLASTTRKSVALSKQDQVLTNTVAGLQEDLDSTTESRIRAEERLAQTQTILQGVTDLVNASSKGLAESLLNMRSAMIALQEVTGMAGAAGVDMSQIQRTAELQRAFGDLAGSVKNFREGLTALGKSGTSFTAAQQKAQASLSAGSAALFNVVGGAQAGFGIGGAIASALGKSGFATQIGGAIGGAIGSVLSAAVGSSGFIGTIASSISGALGGGFLASAFFSFGIPIIGALIGALFAKTPKSGATGGFDEAGKFGILSSYESGGAKSAGLKDVITATYDSFFGTLEQVGIQLAQEAKNFQFLITTRKKTMTAYFQDLEQGIEMAEVVANAKEASEFFINSFLQTFRKGDLIVDSIMPFADNLQAAVDNFATKAIDERMYDSFKRAIDFAIAFDESITALRGSAVSTAEAIELIERAAEANAAQTALYYTRFLGETRDVFGESSTQYEEATAAVRKNSLAQIGLAEIADSGTTSLVSLRDAISEIDVGAVLVKDALEGIRAATQSLRAARVSELDITQAIDLAVQVAVDNLVNDVNDSLVKGLSLLENPAMEAVFNIESLTENASNRLAGIQGTYEQLLKEQGVTAAQLSKQQENIALAAQVSAKELTRALESLTEAELKAVVAAEDLIDAQTRQEASARLAAVQASNLARAQVKIAETNRRLISSLSDTSVFKNLATSVPELLDLFEKTEVDSFVVSLADAINGVATGEQILENFTRAGDLLASEFSQGRITALQYAEGLDLLAENTLDAVDTLESLIDQFEKITKDIVAAYDAQKEAASSALEEIGNSLTTLLDTFGAKTIEVLKLYDTTLASVAKSGNELFNLRDTATEAFESAARAVAEFEEANRLSGRTSTQLLSQIADIESKLSNLSSQPFDFASFIELGKLTSQQRSLQVELKNLRKVEQDYNDLLEARTSAQLDLAFATATIDSLSDTLLDTRRQESETIQRIEDAAKNYLKSQEDLENITKLLAEANFNLNQVRNSENDVVYQTIVALDELYGSFEGLQSLASQIAEANIGGALAESIRTATLAAYDVAFETATEADRKLMPVREAYEQSIIGYFDNLVSATGSIANTLNQNPIGKLSEALKQAAQEITVANLEISDQFKDFGTNLSSYIDLDSVTSSYRASLQAFADSLDVTQYRFAILASSGGPLSNFNSYLVESYNAIGALASNGNFLNLTFERLATSFGNIFSVVGTDSEGLQAAFLGLNIVGATARDELVLVNSELENFKTQLGDVKVTLEGINTSSVPTLIETFSIDITPLNKISALIQAVNVIDTSIGTLNLNTVQSFASSLITFVEGLNSSVSVLNISAISAVSTEIINYIQSIGRSTNIGISLELRNQVVGDVRTYVNAIGDSIPNLTINTELSDDARATINSYVYNVGTAPVGVTVNSALSNSARQTINTFVSGVGNVQVTSSVNVSLRDSARSAINNYVASVGNALVTINVSSVLRDNAVSSVVSYIESVGSAQATFNIDSALSDNAIEQLIQYVEALGNATAQFNISTDLANSAVQNIVQYVEALGNATAQFEISNQLANAAIQEITSYVVGVGQAAATFNISSNLKDTAINTIVNYVESIGAATATFNISSTSLKDNAVMAITNYLTAIGNSTATFSISGTNLSGNARLAITNYLAAIGNNTGTFTISGTNLSNNARLAVTNYLTAIGNNTATFTITGTTLSGNAIAAITNYLTAIGNNTSTFTITGTTLSGNAITAITNYLTAIGNSGNTLSVSFDPTSGLGLSISTFVNNLVNGTGISATYNATASGTIANALRLYIEALLRGSGIPVSYSATASGSLPNAVRVYFDALLKGTGIPVSYDAAAAGTLPNAIKTFVDNVVNGSNIPVSYSLTSGLVGRLKQYIDKLVAGEAIDLTYSTSNTATMPGKVKTYFDALKDTVEVSFNGLSSAFDFTKSSVDALQTSLVQVRDTATSIVTTSGLTQAITELANTSNSVSNLVSSFTLLRSSISTDGVTPLQTLRDKLAQLKSDITTQWSNVVLSAQSTTSTNPAFVRITNTVATSDPNTAQLSTIATNTGKYPKIKNIEYLATPGQFASGGYVSGPGSATSDSIPARLSNGEYVIKASSVSRLGVDMLDALNDTGSIRSALSTSGRNGDTLVAHINAAEARMLKDTGGSGTINPKTGLLEFFNADGGVVGSLFADQEVAALEKTFGDLKSIIYSAASMAYAVGYNSPSFMSTAAIDPTSVKVTTTPSTMTDDVPTIAVVAKQIDAFTANLGDLASRTLAARGSNIASLQNELSSKKQIRWLGRYYYHNNYIRSTVDGKQLSLGSYGDNTNPMVGAMDFRGLDPTNPYPNRFGQTLDMIVNSVTGKNLTDRNKSMNAATLRQYIDFMNEGTRGYFTDLYMLGDLRKKAYTYTPISTYTTPPPPPVEYSGDAGGTGRASGGLVTRDSVSAMLEPGEFVLRKQAVDRMGIDTAIRLNSTGDAGGDIDVEVNINNTGTSQNTVGTPEVRRENGKIVVDIILEDLRTNGPIRRQIRSIR